VTTFDQRDVRCGECGETSSQFVLTSTSSFGPSDLDTRPAEPARSTLWLEVQRCPDCAYCAADITEKPGLDAHKTLGSDLYRSQLSDASYPELATPFSAK
jgi:hypothetical protein